MGDEERQSGSLSQVQQVVGQNRAEEEEEEETYLRKALLPAFSFVVGHLDDLTDLLDEGLALTLQNELTLHLKTDPRRQASHRDQASKKKLNNDLDQQQPKQKCV